VKPVEADEDDREQRLAKNEDFFRKSNEILEREAVVWGLERCDFICECSSRGCVNRLDLTRAEYERVRERGDQFAVAPDHEDLSVEEVVERHPTYLVVRKHGEAGAVARNEDPR
jgi:hypothetical protein